MDGMMTPINRIKDLEFLWHGIKFDPPSPWCEDRRYDREEVAFLEELNAVWGLRHELLALWEAVDHMDDSESAMGRAWDALQALNAKAKEVLG